MTKVALFLPTMRKGGLDVFEASILRQTIKPDLIFVADEHERYASWEAICNTLGMKIELLFVPLRPGDKRNLAASYNVAAEQAYKEDCDLLISVQDYIWIPEYGIERFVKIHEANLNALITGLTHISKDPLPSEINDIESSYTIFKQPFWDKPKEIDWRDVRNIDIYKLDKDATIFPILPEHWEANWAAVPTNMFALGMRWDEEYDKGIAYENADFAKQCQVETGCEILLDVKNEAISLPHKKYWPNEEQEIIKYNNRWLFDSKWDN